MRHDRVSSDLRVKWNNMISRCENPKADAFVNYWTHGIEVCSRWQMFANFLVDLRETYVNAVAEKGLGITLGRIDNDGHYEPGNVRWETALEQGSNRRAPIEKNKKSRIVRFVRAGKTQFRVVTSAESRKELIREMARIVGLSDADFKKETE